MSSGSWSATSRQLILAMANAGMMVLAPSPGEAAVDAAAVERRARPEALEGRVALLAERRGRSGRTRATPSRRTAALAISWRSAAVSATHVVVEAGTRTRPSSSCRRAIICASALTGFATPPPNDPECRSLAGPVDAHLEVHEAAQADAERRDAASEHRRVAHADEVGGEVPGLRRAGGSSRFWLPTSSSPSTMSFRLSGSLPAALTNASMAFSVDVDLPLVVDAPRAPRCARRARQARTAATIHSSSGSTGCTSWWP